MHGHVSNTIKVGHTNQLKVACSFFYLITSNAIKISYNSTSMFVNKHVKEKSYTKSFACDGCERIIVGDLRMT